MRWAVDSHTPAAKLCVKCHVKLDMHSQKLKRIGTLLPPYYEIANFLWGVEADIDSDGNSENPDSLDWNELTLILRSNPEHRIDIDPDPNDDGLLIVKSEIEELLLNTVEFLKSKKVVV